MQKTLSQGRIFIFEKERNFRGGFCSRWSFRTRNTSVVVLAELCLHHSSSSQFLCPTFNDQCSGSFFPLINTWTGLLQGPMVLLSAGNLFSFFLFSANLFASFWANLYSLFARAPLGSRFSLLVPFVVGFGTLGLWGFGPLSTLVLIVFSLFLWKQFWNAVKISVVQLSIENFSQLFFISLTQ